MQRRLFVKLLAAIPFLPSLLEKLPMSPKLEWNWTHIGHIHDCDGSSRSFKQEQGGPTYYTERDKDGNVKEWIEYDSAKVVK